MAKGDPPPPAADPDKRQIPCDPKRVLVAVCQQCHTTPARNMAPFPLLTYADTQVVISNKPIWGYMQSALMRGIMPLPPVQLSPADKATLLGWLAAGAPPSLPSDVCSLVDAGALDGVPDALGDAQVDGAADDALSADEQGDDSQSPNGDAAPSSDAPANDASDAGANPDGAGGDIDIDL